MNDRVHWTCLLLASLVVSQAFGVHQVRADARTIDGSQVRGAAGALDLLDRASRGMSDAQRSVNSFAWTISASDTDPYVNEGTPTGGGLDLYLWLVCSRFEGAQAVSMAPTGTIPVFAFTTLNGAINAGTATDWLIAFPCSEGPLLVGHIQAVDLSGGTMCVGPSSFSGNVTIDCDPINPQEWPNEYLGYSSDGSTPCNTITTCGPPDLSLAVLATHIDTPDPTGVPIMYTGTDSIGALSLFLDYDNTKVMFTGITTNVPGETFLSGIVGGEISIQWFDETGGQDPIVPGIDPDVLCYVNFTSGIASDTTFVTFNSLLSSVGDRLGNPLIAAWLDEPPYGVVVLEVRATVSGRVGYYWLDSPVAGAVLSMGPPNPDVVTDAAGTYSLAPYPFGDYTLEISKADDLGGINSLDAIKIVRHAIGVELLGNAYKEIAADVNADDLINALDAIKVVIASVGIDPLPSGPWSFVPDSRSYAPLNGDRPNQDFVAIRMGDVDGDWQPDGVAREVSPLRTLRSVGVSLPDTSVDELANFIAVPVAVTGFDGVGAVSLRVSFDDSVLHYANVVSAVDGVTFTTNLVGNEVRIEWFDGTGGAAPISIGAGTLLTIGFDINGSAGEESALHFGQASAIGDDTGNPIPSVLFDDGLVTIQAAGVGVVGAILPVVETRLFPVVPNPTLDRVEIRYDIAGAREAAVRIFDVAGRMVRSVTTGLHESRPYTVVWDRTDDGGRVVPAGVYFVHLDSGNVSQTQKVVLVR